MRGSGDERPDAPARPSGRRAGLPCPHGGPPARAPGALLPDPRLGPGRRGPRPGDAAGRLARAGRLRRARVAALVAVPDRHQPLSQRAARQRPEAAGVLRADGPANAPDPTRMGEPIWLQPYPDALLEGLPDRAPGPDARYETREAVGLAFVSGLQRMPPHQRAVLVLRDVLGYRAAEVAAMLDSSEASVNSALQRARAALAAAPARPDGAAAARLPGAARAAHPLRRRLRGRRHRRGRRAAHRRRLDADAPRAARVPGPRRRSPRSCAPAGCGPAARGMRLVADPRQRPARLRLLRPATRNGGVARGRRPARARRRGRGDLRADALRRPRRAAVLRVAADAARRRVGRARSGRKLDLCRQQTERPILGATRT